MKHLAIKMLMLGSICASQITSASLVNWTDWTSATTGAAGSASGNIGSVNLSYTGDVTFAQLGAGTNYWTEGANLPYTASALVDNAPTPAEMVAMSLYGVTNTLTFSQAVVNPIFAIVSQGQYGVPVTYDFDQPFTVLSEGLGYWGDGSYTLGAGDALTGRELHAAIQFIGTFNSISWVADQGEYWHGFTVGLVESGPKDVPEPGAALLMGLGLLGLFAASRRRT
jgi:hypothetical protein